MNIQIYAQFVLDVSVIISHRIRLQPAESRFWSTKAVLAFTKQATYQIGVRQLNTL